ncbi:MAG: peptidoglycan bridge formation glycyltransferase FemA/FemB family protein [Flavobacteriaceae bacterium]|nr:peptidoglycan bridge formation glycyltransferase FemA/FemB family protein [Flavobacteriaceae bacterium]
MSKILHHKNIIAKDTDLNFYDELVQLSQRSTPFHSLDFLNLIRETYKVKLKFTVVYRDTNIIAMMPYFVKNNNPLRMKSSWLGCYGGFLYLEEDRDDLISYLSKNTTNQPFSTIISFDDDLLSLTQKWHKAEDSTWILNTNTTYEEVYKSIHYKTRNQIQKSIKSEVTVSNIKTNEELEQVKQIYKNLIAKHSLKHPFSDHFFDTAFSKSLSSENLIFKIAEKDKTVISFSFFICNSTAMFYWINASNPEYLNLNGTNALLNDAIKDCTNSSIKTLNFGGVPASNKGLLHFKKRWNTYEHKYTTYTNNFFYKLKHLI